LAFSRKSSHYQEIPNSTFDQLKPVNVDNFPVIVKQGTIAYQLQEVLNTMKNNGIIEQLYEKYNSLE